MVEGLVFFFVFIFLIIFLTIVGGKNDRNKHLQLENSKAPPCNSSSTWEIHRLCENDVRFPKQLIQSSSKECFNRNMDTRSNNVVAGIGLSLDSFLMINCTAYIVFMKH